MLPTSQELFTRIPVILIALTVHEFSHAYAAFRCGDDTAKRMGRLTLNPLAHLDPLGTICLLFAPIGWAKPVPINPYYFRNPRRDEIIVSAAGPASNFAMAVIAAVMFKVSWDILHVNGNSLLFLFLFYAVLINIVLGLFNLLPIFPLDGSHILKNILPWHMAEKMEQFRQYGMFIIIGIVILGNVTGLFRYLIIATKLLLNLVMGRNIFQI
ncbi:MAG: site-2 protease family protein [Planctomycetota bacterium]|nr:MAG: site-2 protease family protein [Planctomycetota bacterium]